MLEWLEKSLEKQSLSVSAEDYLKDLTESLCIITCEGHRYRFAHRSFQTYFAAKYTRTLSDQQQKTFLTDKFNWDSNTYWEDYYLDLLNQIDHERFLNNLIEPTCQNIISKYHSEQMFSQHILSYIDIQICSTPAKPVCVLTTDFPSPDYKHLLSYINCKIAINFSSAKKLDSSLLRKYSEVDDKTCKDIISLKYLLNSDNISEGDKNILSNCILDAFQVHETYQAITAWLAEREAARRKPSSDDKFADY